MGSTSPKVAHLTTVDLSLRFLVLPQLVAARDLGIESVGISAPGPWVADLERRGIRHLPLASSTRGVSLSGDLRAAWDLFRLLREVRPQILHTHNPKPGIYGRIVGRMAGVPIVVNTVHGLYATPDDRLGKRVAVYLLEALASRFSDAELVQSLEDTVLMTRLRIVPRGRIAHLGNGVDLTRFRRSGQTAAIRARLRAELEVDDGQILVGMVGRLVKEKGYLELFEAARRLDERFVIVCIGPEDPDKSDSVPPAVIAAARELGVRFLGMRDDVEDLYAAMDVFVLPSHREGFPRAAMEAAAMGLPIVATDIRGCREVVEPGRNGLLVPVGSIDALAAAIEQMADPALRGRMAGGARAVAEQRFDEQQVVATVLGTYLRMARSKGLNDLAAVLGRETQKGEISTRPAVSGDCGFLASLHARALARGFLPRLGEGFLTVLYRGLVDDPESVVLVAEDRSGIVGFVAGTSSTSGFYRRFLRRHGPAAALAAGLRLLRPSFLKRAVESLRYGSQDDAAGAELLSMAVVADRRGEGISTRLGGELITSLGTDLLRVVVSADNQVAIAAYRRMGFVPVTTVEVHRGERSEVLEWSG